LQQRLKTAGIYAGCVAAVCGVSFALWKSGSFARIGTFASEQTYALTAAAGFRVDEIVITGRSHVPQDQILKRLGAAHGASIFSVDLEEAKAALLEIPRLKEARVSRRLPSRIVVSIAEREPVALWQYNKKISLIDADGVILSSDNLDAYGDLPLVVGDDAGKTAAALFALLKAEPEISSEIASAARVGDRRWDLHLKNGVVVMLPAQDAELALARLARVEARDKILSKDILRIDLRLPDKMVVEPNARKDVAAGKDNKENI
jgi:cell division protein FtsQ